MVGGELSFPRIKCLAEWPSKANFTIEKYSMNSSRDSESMANKCGTSAANRNWCILRDGVGLEIICLDQHCLRTVVGALLRKPSLGKQEGGELMINHLLHNSTFPPAFLGFYQNSRMETPVVDLGR